MERHVNRKQAELGSERITQLEAKPTTCLSAAHMFYSKVDLLGSHSHCLSTSIQGQSVFDALSSEPVLNKDSKIRDFYPWQLCYAIHFSWKENKTAAGAHALQLLAIQPCTNIVRIGKNTIHQFQHLEWKFQTQESRLPSLPVSSLELHFAYAKCIQWQTVVTTNRLECLGL